MSSIARIESNNLFSNFVREMDSREILLATGKPLSEAYAAIASRMFGLGLNEAATLAEEYARKHDTNKVARVARNAGYLADQFTYVIRTLLPADILVKIKKFIFHLQASKMQRK